MSDDETLEVVRAAVNGTSPATLAPMIGGLELRDQSLLDSACRRLLAAIYGSGTSLDEFRRELSSRVGTSTFAADKGDYEWGHRHRDKALVDALRAILDHPDAASELAAIALAAVDESDERYYSF